MPQRLGLGQERKVTKSFSMEEALYNAYQTISRNRYSKISPEIRKLIIEDVKKEIKDKKYPNPAKELLIIVGFQSYKQRGIKDEIK